MKQRPILFSTPMVQAILEGRKTQTRRVVKIEGNIIKSEMNPLSTHEDGSVFYFWGRQEVKCPYGQIGDILWVRESYCKDYFFYGGGGHAYKADWNEDASEYVPKPKWKPSIHMPKDACRIFLRITNVRVERLQEIGEEDAINEGIERFPPLHWWKNYIDQPLPGTTLPSLSFMTLWQSINGEQSWNDNPWVWVIEFERVEGGEI